MIEVKLPIGVEDSLGNRFNTVIVDKMRGVDEYNMDQPDVRNNPERAYTSLIRRVILEIPGLINRKNKSDDLIDEKLVANMYSVDREAILLGMLKQSPKTDTDVIVTCRKCGYRLPTEHFDLKNATITKELDLGAPTEIPFELEDGFTVSIGDGPNAQVNTYKTGTIRFPRGADNEAIGSINNAGERVTSLLFRCTKFDGMPANRKAIEMLTSVDRIKLFKILGNEIPRYDLSIKKVCPDCESKVVENVNFLDFFGAMQEEE